MKIFMNEDVNDNYDAKQVLKTIKDSIYKDFDIVPFQVYYNPSSIKIVYGDTLSFLTEDEYNETINSGSDDDNELIALANAVSDKVKKYLSSLPIPKNCIKEARVNFSYHGTFQILIRRKLPEVDN